MKQIERVNLIGSIACELQSIMTTTQINVFLSGFDITCEDVSCVSSKRLYVEKLLKSESPNLIVQIATELGLHSPETIGSKNLSNYLKENGYEAAHDDFERAMSSVEADPEQAMGNASSILESICKSILDRMGGDSIPKDQSLSGLVKATYGVMKLSPASYADPDIKRVLGGIANAAVGIGVIRTKYSSFHGRSDNQKRYKLTARHARLAVGSAAVLGCFLIETYTEKFINNNGKV